MSNAGLLNLREKSVSLTRKDDGTEIRLGVAGSLALDPSCHYESLYLHTTLLGREGQVLMHEESSIDGHPDTTGEMSFGVREYVPYALAKRTAQVRVAVVGRVFSPDETITVPMDSVLTETDAVAPVSGQEILVVRKRPDSDGEVRMRVTGNAVFEPHIRYEQLQVVVSLLDARGAVLYTDTSCPDIYGGTQSPTPYRASLYVPEKSVESAVTVSVRLLTQALLRAESPPISWREVIDLSADLVESGTSSSGDVFDEDDFFG